MSDIVCIHKPTNEMIGELMRQDLADAGIKAVVANRGSVALWGGGSLPLLSLELLVSEDQAQQALTLLSEKYDLDQHA